MRVYDKNNIKCAIRNSVKKIYEAEVNFVNEKLYSNTLDCYSAVLDAISQNISIEEWLKQEKARQIQKTKQNAIGNLHEEIIGSFNGVSKLHVGKVYDIHFPNKKIIAEVKNKHNTTKGNHKTQIYRDLEYSLNKLKGYTGYYVEILPINGKSYDIPFTPSDNLTKKKLRSRDDIRKIDGKSFYKIITGEENAMGNIYLMLPEIIKEILKEEFNFDANIEVITNQRIFKNLYNKIFPNSI